MHILLIEDKEKHLLSAARFAAQCGHKVTIATSYEEAEKHLYGECDYGSHWPKNEPEKFDVVLTDLLLPASLTGIGNSDVRKKFEGSEQCYGLGFVLLAMKQGVKAIGLFTDGNHHNHPMIWAMDTLGGYDAKPFTVGDTTVMFASNGPYISSYNKEGETNHVPKGDPLDGAKDWLEFWLMLINSRSPFAPL
jgi:CheY-like chemotaxis protein